MAIINGTQFNDNNTFNGGAFRFSLIGTSDSDIVNGLAGNDILDGRDGDDQLKGGTGNDTLRGGNGNDSLDGGAGGDNMDGGDGIDTYFVNNVGDVAAETNNTANGGFDTVIATVSHTLGFAIEDLFLSGNTSINGKGNDKDNHIIGNGAANILNGAAGADRMTGGNGNDTYIVDNVGDVVIEDSEDPVAGIDTVNASVDFSLSFGINNLKLTGIGAIDGFGNELNNIISGNGAANFIDAGSGNDTINSGAGNDILRGSDGNDTLNGGSGADNMDGGDQNDTYIVDNAGDIAAEQSIGNQSGYDVVQSSVSHTLGFGIENLLLTGSAVITGIGNDLDNLIEGNGAANALHGETGNDRLYGRGGNDWLLGGDGNDFLSGESGNDILVGGNGNDRLSGGLGNDTLFGDLGEDEYGFFSPLGVLNVDQINGFSSASDTIVLLDTTFSKLPSGIVAPQYFRANATGTAVDADDFLLYNTTTGGLFYDSDGNGAGGAVQFAILSGAPIISAADFSVMGL